MAGEGTGDVVMVFDSSGGGGEDYIPLLVDGRLYNHRVLQIGGPAAYRRPEAISSVQDAEEEEEEALLSADPVRDGGEEEEQSVVDLPVPRLPGRGGPSPFLSSRPRPRAGLIPRLKKLETTRYAGGGDGGTSTSTSTGCAICMEEYVAEDELSVVPCSGKHRFHRECLAAWLARKRLCPLCRHALPAADEPH